MTLEILAAGTGAFVPLKAGQRLRIVDAEGGQSGDLMAYREGDSSEWLSNGRSFDYNETIYLTTGNILYSNDSNAMLTIVRDEVGRHDFLYAPCSPEMYRIQYGDQDHPNCLENIVAALRHLGIEPSRVPTAFNFFMNSRVDEGGRLSILPPLSKAGDAIEFRAEMDLAIALTACPASTCNGGASKTVHYEILA